VLPAGVTAAAAIVEFYDTPNVIITRRGIREGVIVDSVRQSTP
jgi:exopolyphosphatase/pppGpp-phosphohydrolase